MQLDVRCHGVDLDDATRTYLDRRLAFATNRFRAAIASLSVRLRPLGRDDGSGMSCWVTCQLHRGGWLFVCDAGYDRRGVIDTLCDRLGHALARRFDEHRRHGVPV